MKSHVTMEQAVCPVCLETYDTGTILLDRRLRECFESRTVTHMAMCPEHQKLRDDGYIALIEIDPTKTPDSGSSIIDPNTAYRTGTIMHITEHGFNAVFNVEIPAGGIVFVEPEVTAKLAQLREDASA